MDKQEFLRIAITVDYPFPCEPKEIERCLEEKGFDYVHIRKPGIRRETLGALINGINPKLRNRITLHDHFSLAAEYGIGGIHLNRRNPFPPDKWEGRLSASCHSFEECQKYSNLDYVTLSPIFHSFSKPGYSGNFEKKEVRNFLSSEQHPPIIALGGITSDKIDAIRQLGFNGAAMLTDAWRKQIDLSDFQLQFITHPSSVEDAIKQTENVLEGGCRWIQLRWKEADDSEYIEAAHQIRILCNKYDAVFLLNDRVHLVKETSADGVHLGISDMPVNETRMYLGPTAIIGRTANTPHDIVEGIFVGADYIGLGPYRFTETKKKLSPVLGIQGYVNAMEYLYEKGLEIPIVAIGGITESDIPKIISSGVDGIAVSGYIIKSNSPAVTTQSFLDEITKEKLTIKK